MSNATGNKKEQEPKAEAQGLPVCPACGAEARRVDARFCGTCGRMLSEHYLPADALRASYHLHRSASSPVKRSPLKTKRPKMSAMTPEINRNGASTTALALATYALVPFLGILFIPGALLIGTAGLAYSFYAPHKGGRRTAFASILLGFVIFGVQVCLWWIIIKVPEWTNPGTGGF